MLVWYIESNDSALRESTNRGGSLRAPVLLRTLCVSVAGTRNRGSWQIWVPWVRMHLLRARQYDPSVNAAIDSAESRRLRQRHTEHILDLTRDGISIGTIRRHRLDDPRLTDEVRAMLAEAARERQSKAWFRRPEDQRVEDRLATIIRLGPIVNHAAPEDANNECPETCALAAAATRRKFLPISSRLR